MYLSVIIPAYNEQNRLPKTLVSIDNYLSSQSYLSTGSGQVDYEIIVVNDGSKDETSRIVNNLMPKIKNLKFIDNKVNRGKGAAVKRGILEAKGEIRLFMDADNATSIDHFEKMIPYFERGFDIVIGSRDSKDAKGAKQAVPQSFLRRLLGNFGNILIQIVAVPGIWDTQCGFKAFNKKAAEDIFPRLKIERWGFDIEILALARKFKYKIAIIPVYWKNDPESKVKLKGYFQVFRELFQIKWNLINHKYD